MAALTREAMAESTPNRELASLRAHDLGQADVFLSHSWRDPSGAKWAALQAWAAAFRRRHGGREPTLWIDKYSIDQDQIRDSLTCLPVFVSGCRKLLLAVGPTYCERWCVLEVWAFFTMGGDIGDVELVVLDDAGGRAAEAIGDGLRRFDAANAECHDPEDRERLLAIVEAGGGVAHLNELVRRLADVPELRDEQLGGAAARRRGGSAAGGSAAGGSAAAERCEA